MNNWISYSRIRMIIRRWRWKKNTFIWYLTHWWSFDLIFHDVWFFSIIKFNDQSIFLFGLSLLWSIWYGWWSLWFDKIFSISHFPHFKLRSVNQLIYTCSEIHSVFSYQKLIKLLFLHHCFVCVCDSIYIKKFINVKMKCFFLRETFLY